MPYWQAGYNRFSFKACLDHARLLRNKNRVFNNKNRGSIALTDKFAWRVGILGKKAINCVIVPLSGVAIHSGPGLNGLVMTEEYELLDFPGL